MCHTIYIYIYKNENDQNTEKRIITVDFVKEKKKVK